MASSPPQGRSAAAAKRSFALPMAAGASLAAERQASLIGRAACEAQVGARLLQRAVWRGRLLLLILVAGCPDARDHIAPRDEREALERVNGNLARINEPLQYKALVSFSFRDAGGKDRRFLGHEASLVFHRPRYLRFDIRSLVGEIAQFGSNEERYWVWVEPEVDKLWWGYWERLERGATNHLPQSGAVRLPLPPDDLLDALLLRPLPEALAGGLHPVLRMAGDDHRLLFWRLGEDGQTSGLREVRLDPYEPYQPLEIIDRLPDGRVQMHAQLEKYRRIGEDGPFTARRYVVYWPLDEAEMRLDVTRAVFRPDLPLEVFEFPFGWQGEVEQIDAAGPPGLSRAAREDVVGP